MPHTPEEVDSLLHHYDEKVIEGLENGNIHKVMAMIEPEIVSQNELQSILTY